MRVRWGLVMLPATLISLILLLMSQFVFLRMSLFKDRGFGQFDPSITFGNYIQVFSDPFYYTALGLTLKISIIVLALSVLVGYPVAFVLTRISPRTASTVIAAVVASALVAEVIKVLGLIVVFNADGPLNRLLIGLGLIVQPIKILGSTGGVVLGMLHFTLGFVVLLIFSVLQTIPKSLEEAAEIHGANRLRVFWRVILPLSMPGVAIASLIIFNVCMGSFTATSLLGGGRILTIPVLIERTMILETKYGMAACLAAVLLGTVLFANVLVALGLSYSRVGQSGHTS